MDVLKVDHLAYAGVRLQQAHDDLHGRLVIADAAQARHHQVVQVQRRGLCRTATQTQRASVRRRARRDMQLKRRHAGGVECWMITGAL